jgi:hypothetical protein
LIFSTTFVWNFFILRRIEQGVIKNLYWFSCTVPSFMSDFKQAWILLADFQKILNIKFHENPYSGSQVFPSGRTDKMLLIITFYKFVNVLNKVRTVLLVGSYLSCCSHNVLCKLYESCSDGTCCCPTGAYDSSAVDQEQCSKICMLEQMGLGWHC